MSPPRFTPEERICRNVQMSWTDVATSGGIQAFSPWLAK